MAKSSKVFDTEFNGFNKKQVNEYIEKLVSQYQQSLNDKTNECDELRAKNEQLSAKLNELSDAYIKAQEDKAKIADVLINAENTAKNMIAQAEAESEEKREKLSVQVDEKRMLIVDMNKNIRDMKIEIEKMVEEAKSRMNNSLSLINERLESERQAISSKIDEINSKYTAED